MIFLYDKNMQRASLIFYTQYKNVQTEFLIFYINYFSSYPYDIIEGFIKTRAHIIMRIINNNFYFCDHKFRSLIQYIVRLCLETHG